MGLISTEVEITLSNKKISHYENLGYEIPKVETSNGMRTPRGTKIKVKVKDLSHGSHVKIMVQCDGCGKMYETTYQSYYKHNRNGKTYCLPCTNKLFNSGENHSRWNFNKTDEERLIKRNYPEYTEFVKRVLIRDNYTCQCCGKKSDKDMAVHHLYSYAGFPEYRTDQMQAITLCGNCHNAFHSWHQQKYGFAENGNCTREQFETWYGKAINVLQKHDGILPTTKKVFDYEEGKIYQSAKEYAKIHKLDDTNVYSCCNHKVNKYEYIKLNGEISYCEHKVYTAGGHHLFWLDEYEKMSQNDIDDYLKQSINKTYTPVVCITTGRVFKSIVEAVNCYRISGRGSNIGSCCIGRQKTSGKLNGVPLKWMYLSDFKKLPQEEQEKILANVKEELS